MHHNSGLDTAVEVAEEAPPPLLQTPTFNKKRKTRYLNAFKCKGEGLPLESGGDDGRCGELQRKRSLPR